MRCSTFEDILVPVWQLPFTPPAIPSSCRVTSNFPFSQTLLRNRLQHQPNHHCQSSTSQTNSKAREPVESDPDSVNSYPGLPLKVMWFWILAAPLHIHANLRLLSALPSAILPPYIEQCMCHVSGNPKDTRWWSAALLRLIRVGALLNGRKLYSWGWSLLHVQSSGLYTMSRVCLNPTLLFDTTYYLWNIQESLMDEKLSMQGRRNSWWHAVAEPINAKLKVH